MRRLLVAGLLMALPLLLVASAEANHRHRTLSLHRGDTWDITCNNSIAQSQNTAPNRVQGVCVASTTPTPIPTSVPQSSPTPTNTPNPTPSPTATPPPSSDGLRVAVNRIVNASGQPVQLHGVNRSGNEYACVDGWGFGDGPYDAPEIAAMKTWNINVARVTLNESCWLNYGGVPSTYSGAAYQNEIERYVNLLTSNGIAAIIDLHWNSPGNAASTGQEPMADRDHSNAFWASVANRFKSNPNVLFNTFNEPHDISWACWRDGGCTVSGFVAAGQQEMVNAIRATGATNIIVLNGNNWGSDLSGWQQYKPNDSLNQLVAGWHSYGDGLSCQNEACWNSVLANVLTDTPILATEIGQFDCQHDYIDRVMSFLDGHMAGYMAWSWGPHNCSNDPALLTDWNGNPSQTYGQGFKDHLLTRP